MAEQDPTMEELNGFLPNDHDLLSYFLAGAQAEEGTAAALAVPDPLTVDAPDSASGLGEFPFSTPPSTNGQYMGVPTPPSVPSTAFQPSPAMAMSVDGASPVSGAHISPGTAALAMSIPGITPPSVGDVPMALVTPPQVGGGVQVSQSPPPPTGVNSAGSTGSAAMSESEARRQRRLARNRESARQSRRRKKQYLELLEDKVSQLTAELDSARRTHVADADRALRELKHNSLHNLYERLQQTPEGDPSAQEDIANHLRSLRDRTGPCCTERLATSAYLFKQLRDVLLPPHFQFILWTANQGDTFYRRGPVSDDGRQSLWSLLAKELNLTGEQQDKLEKQVRAAETPAAAADRHKLTVALQYLERLEHSLHHRAQAVQNLTDRVQSVLTPEQTVRYLYWVERNRDRLQQACSSADGASAAVAAAAASGTQASTDSGPAPPQMAELLSKPDNELTLEDVTALFELQMSFQAGGGS